MQGPGPVALVGGAEWGDGCDFDADLLSMSGASEVVVLPTAAAYQHPERAVETAAKWFGSLGGKVVPVMVLGRADAESEEHVAAVRAARFVYLGGGSPLHLRSVLKGSAVWEALLAAWRDGAIVAGSSAGAMVLTDSMIDPRGGGFSLGLGLVEQLAVIPHHQDPQATNVLRSVMLAPAGLAVAGIPERTALIWDGRESGWREAGAGHVTVYRDGAVGTLADLPA